jgi:phosphate transport system permease protein
VSDPSAPVFSPAPARRWRQTKNAVATGAFSLSVLVMLVPLVLVVGYTIERGAAVIGWHFLNDPIQGVDQLAGGGMKPAIVGTLLITGAAAAMAIPLGILGAIYLNEYGGTSRLATVLRLLADVMTGVPSIVMGLFIFTIFVLRFKEFTGFAGALALACLMLPIVIRATEEMLKLVPSELREASYALGCRKARTIVTVVLPAALSGIVSGCLLAIARAAGETAPLLLVIGITYKTNTDLFEGPNTALSTQIFRGAGSSFDVAKDRAWGAALTLIAITFAFTILARIVTAVLTRRTAS